MTTSGSQSAKSKGEDPGALLLVRAGAAGVRADLSPAEIVIGSACECEPLFEAERALLAKEPDRVIEGLAAALLATGAKRGVLAVRADFGEALGAARRAAHGRAIEVVSVLPYYPVDELLPLEIGCADASASVRVIGVRELADLAEAMRAKPITSRLLTIAGAVREPRVARIPIGTPIAEIVGTDEPAWVALTGALRGRQLDRDEVVDAEMAGLLVLPAGHPVVQGRKRKLAEELRRAKSACVECRLCTDACPHALAGAPLDPHLALRVIAHRGRGDRKDAAVRASLCCTGCGVCDVVCPASLHPSGVYQRIGAALRDEGIPPLEFPAAPHPDRAGRRLSIDLLTARLGLGEYEAPGTSS